VGAGAWKKTKYCDRFSISVSLAILAAMRRASSFVSEQKMARYLNQGGVSSKAFYIVDGSIAW
jgi:hypothetical protein